MSYLPYFLLGLAALIMVVQLRPLLAGRRMQGRPAPALDDLLGEAGRDPRLLYFYSEHCPPCRAMTPVIDAVAAGREGVLKLDVTRLPEAARRFGVVATPTVVLVRDGAIARVALGALSQPRLEALLECS